MSYQHKVRFMRVSPKKLRMVAKLILGKNTKTALDILTVQKQKGSSLLYKAISAAVNNAEANNIDVTKMDIISISSNKGPVFMRRWIRPRGMSQPKRKYTSHALIVFGQKKKKVKTRKAITKEVKAVKKVTNKK